MKIVRLTESEEGVAFFDNIFNDEINLPPFSEVALASVSINTDPASIEAGSVLILTEARATSLNGGKFISSLKILSKKATPSSLSVNLTIFIL